MHKITSSILLSTLFSIQLFAIATPIIRVESADELGIFKIKNKIKAVIFDLDGTVVNSERAWQIGTQCMLAKHGVPPLRKVEHDKLYSTFGIPPNDWAKMAHEMFNPSVDLATLQADISVCSHHLGKEAFDLVPGFERLCLLLKAVGIQCGIASNANQAHFDRMIDLMGIKPHVGEHAYTTTMLGCGHKPDPASFLLTAEKLGVKPSECIVFEDSHFGFQAAKAAGMPCIGIRQRWNKGMDGEVAKMIDSFDQAIPAMLLALEGDTKTPSSESTPEVESDQPIQIAA
jgi:beta-phosphoglucomutase